MNAEAGCCHLGVPLAIHEQLEQLLSPDELRRVHLGFSAALRHNNIERLEVKHVAAEDERRLHDLLQLTHIPWPGALLKQLHRRACDRCRLARSRRTNEMFDQYRDIVDPLS
jgi:hypothetical protein